MLSKTIFLRNGITVNLRSTPDNAVRVSLERADLTVFFPPMGIHDLRKFTESLGKMTDFLEGKFKGIEIGDIILDDDGPAVDVEIIANDPKTELEQQMLPFVIED
jgi:hypothetical protein